MKLLIDAQLSPAIAAWVNRTFNEIEAVSVQSLGLRDATDVEIFETAKKIDAIVVSKDDDFKRLIEKSGAPPKLIWITCGNTSNARMREILSSVLIKTKEMLESGEDIVEISDKEE